MIFVKIFYAIKRNMLITAMQLTENFNIGMMGNGLVF